MTAEDHAPNDELEALRRELEAVKAQARLFGLVWQDRKDEREADIETFGVGLRAEPALAVKTPAHRGGPSHFLIQGDNLEALTALRSTHLEAIDVIYLDPPYNTGNTDASGFVYTDKFRGEDDAERHSRWLSMMRRRLELGRELLKPTGVVLISIDDNEIHHLRSLCDLVFGERNFIAQLVWDGGNVKNNARLIAGSHEYVLVYARSNQALRDAGTVWREPRPGLGLLVDKYNSLRAKHGNDFAAITAAMKAWVKSAPLTDRMKVFYNADARGLYTYADLSAPGRSGANYDVTHPVTGLPCKVPARGWGVSQERMDALRADDRLIFGKDHTYQVMRKLYLSERSDQVRRSVLSYPARSSTHLLQHMLGRRNGFNNPKNIDLIKDLLRLVGGRDAVILDFFAGSGTTGHAVLALNAEDDGARQFLLVTNNENDIFNSVTLPRLRAAITGKWGDGSTHAPLNGHMQVLTTVPLRDGRAGKANLPGIAGYVNLLTGQTPDIGQHAACGLRDEAPVVAWDGKGTLAELDTILEQAEQQAGRPGVIVAVDDLDSPRRHPDQRWVHIRVGG